MNTNIGIALLIGLAAAAIYFLVTHKGAIKDAVAAETATLRVQLASGIDSLHKAVGMVHQAALAPVSVVMTPTAATAPVDAPPAAQATPAAPAAAAAPAASSGPVVPPGFELTSEQRAVLETRSAGGGAVAPAAFDAAAFGRAQGVHYDPTFMALDDDPKSFDFPIAAGGYTVAGASGAQDGEMHFALSQNGAILASDAAPAFTAVDGQATFTVTLAKTNPTVMARAGNPSGVSRGSYNIYRT